jgi:hypothetical protein
MDQQQATSGVSDSDKSLLTRIKEAPIVIKVVAGIILLLVVTACIGIPIYMSRDGGNTGRISQDGDKDGDKGKTVVDKVKLAQDVKVKIQDLAAKINLLKSHADVDVTALKAELDGLKQECTTAELEVKDLAPLSEAIVLLVDTLVKEASTKGTPAEIDPIATIIDELIKLEPAESLKGSKGAALIDKEKKKAEAIKVSEDAKKKSEEANKKTEEENKKTEAFTAQVRDLVTQIGKLDSNLNATELSASVAKIRKDCDDAKLQTENILKPLSVPIKALIEKLIEAASAKVVEADRVPIATIIDELISLKLLDSPLKDSKGVDLKDPKGSDLIARRVNEKKAVEDAKKTLSDEQKAEETKRLEEEKRKRAEAKRQEMIDAEKARKEAVAKEEAKESRSCQ